METLTRAVERNTRLDYFTRTSRCEEYSSPERRLMAVPHLSPVFPALLIETAATHDFYRPYT